MNAATLGALLALLGGGAGDHPQRVYTPHGWYQVEDGWGETEDAEIFLVVSEDDPADAPAVAQAPAPPPQAPPPQAPPPQAPPQPAPPPPQASPPPAPPPARPQQPQGPPDDLQREIAAFAAIDCDEVRGRYLQRVLQLNGVNAFDQVDPRLLAAWTQRRPEPRVGLPYYWGAFADPTLSILWGEPPVPPGLLSADFTLQGLARDLLRCEAGWRSRLVPPPAVAPQPPQQAPPPPPQPPQQQQQQQRPLPGGGTGLGL